MWQIAGLPGYFVAVQLPTTAQRSRLTALSIGVRPTLLFVVAYALNATPHESVHALTAHFLGFNATIFPMWVNPDRAVATRSQLAAIAVAGPLFSLVFGLICLGLYAAWLRRRSSGLIFLMLGLVGIDSFIGPMAGAAFGGDFHTAFLFWGTPAWIEIITSGTGFLLLAWFMFRMGWELASWIPGEMGRTMTVLCTVVGPALIGPLLILVIYWPLPRMLVLSTLSGSVFWIFAVAGAAFAYRSFGPQRALSGLTHIDVALVIAVIVMVRVLATGIRLGH